ncbi:MAG TPA: hypothetical protein VMY16_06705 [Ilumatobacteraceae bacterium]|nr:hypothetical protein [Ilumatobacteraceae bacterium]
MTDQDDVRSARDVDVDAERFVDEVDEVESGVTRAVDLPPEGSIPDIIDQHTAVPEDDEA